VTRLGRWAAVACGIILSAAPLSSQQQKSATAATEYEVKAAFLYNFAKGSSNGPPTRLKTSKIRL